LREVFGRMGYSDQEIVALSGAHNLGQLEASIGSRADVQDDVTQIGADLMGELAASLTPPAKLTEDPGS
jgi:catalase (peroxidase I)